MNRGDTVIPTSDGVVKAKNSADEIFNFERLEQAVNAGPTTSAQAMLDHLKTKVVTFAGKTEQHDYMTIVVIQI